MIRTISFSVISLLLIATLSCSTESTPAYVLTTTVSPAEGGEITPNEGSFEGGETVSLEAVPNEGWVFTRWEGDQSSTENPSTITMDSDKDIIGVFERKDYTLNITIEGEGTVQEQIVSQPKTTDYPYETVVELTPVPSEDYEFVEWGGDLSGSETPTEITIDGEKNVTVNFLHVLEGRTLQEVNGSGIRETNYPSSETEDISRTWYYDTNENLTEFVSYGSEGSISNRTTYTYDSNNNVTERISYGSDDSISFRTTYTYDSNNNLTELISYGSDGSISYRATYTYDSNNNVTESISYGSDGSPSNRTTYTYDSNNNVTERISYGSDGSISSKATYTYDSDNNMIKYVFNSDTYDWTGEYEYDFNGHIIEYNDVYNFLNDNSWYKTTTTETRDNIYYERGMKITNQKTPTVKPKNYQLIWEFNRLNTNSDELQSPNRDIMERLDLNFVPNPYLNRPNGVY